MKQANLRPLPKDDLEHCSRLTESLWKDHRGARIFLTGGTGFFGKWLQATFAHANRTWNLDTKLVVLTRDPQKAAREFPQTGVEYVEGDIRDFRFPEGSFTHVIHAATPVLALWDSSQALETLDVTYLGTKRVLDFAATQKLENFLLVSSGAVYGPQPEKLSSIPESYFGGPDCSSVRTAYSEGKRVSETLTHLVSKSKSVPFSIARCFAFVGPYMPLDGGFAAGNFLANVRDRVPIEIKGTGEDVRSFMHTADLSVWLWTILFRGAIGQIYNVGSPEAVTIAALARRTAPLGASEVKILGKWDANGFSRYVPDVLKAKRELGLEIKVPLDEALRRTFDWLKTP